MGLNTVGEGSDRREIYIPEDLGAIEQYLSERLGGARYADPVSSI